MAYFQGLSTAPVQQNNTPAIPNAPTGVVSGGAQGQPGAQQNGYGSFSMAQAPNAVLNNISQYNSAGIGTLASSANQQQGLNNYLQMSQQYGQQPGVYQPWAFQDQASGGYGSNGFDVGNLFGVAGGQAGQIQAGSDYTFGNNAGQIMQSQYYRNPYTGEIEVIGAAQEVNNPYASLYGANNRIANTFQTVNGMGGSAISGASSAEEVQARIAQAQAQNAARASAVNALGQDYYNTVNANFGGGQFDTRNFNSSMAQPTYNPIYGNAKPKTVYAQPERVLGDDSVGFGSRTADGSVFTGGEFGSQPYRNSLTPYRGSF